MFTSFFGWFDALFSHSLLCVLRLLLEARLGLMLVLGVFDVNYLGMYLDVEYLDMEYLAHDERCWLHQATRA